MKRLLILVFFAFVLWPHAGRATTCSVPNSFVNGTTADANAVNANFSSLVSCGNAIDNTNIGSSGIYASQIKPTTGGQATFGGSIGYTINPNAAAQVPLTILNAASPTADYIDVTNSGSTKLAWVDSAGSLNALVVAPSASFSGKNGPVVVAQATATPTQQPGNVNVGSLAANAANSVNTYTGTNGNAVIAQATAAPTTQPGNTAISGTATASTFSSTVTAGSADAILLNNGITNTTGIFANNSTVVASVAGPALVVAQNGGSNLLALDNSGDLGAAAVIVGTGVKSLSSGATYSYVPPVYTSSGLAVASTLHGVLGTCTVTFSCTITFSGAAAFSSGTSYSCTASFGTVTENGFDWTFSTQSSTSTVLATSINLSGLTVSWSCIGT